MSTDPRVAEAMELVDDHASESATDTIECERGGMSTTDLDKTRSKVESYIESMAAEIARLTAELYDEKAVNETQRYELQERLQKQLAAEAELKEARRIVQALECLFSPYATDSTQRDWMDRATAMTKEKP